MIRLLTGPFAPYVLGVAAALFFALTGFAAIQTLRLGSARNALEACNLAQEKAQAEAKERAAEIGVKVIEKYVERENEDREPVVRTVDRIRNVCLRPEGHLQVPSAAGKPAGTDAEARNDREFAEALGRDIAACSSALNRCTAIQDFVCQNGGCD